MAKTKLPSLVPVTEPEYSLLDEPWLGAVMKDGTIQRFGLVGLFKNLNDVSSLVTDTEMEEPALFRFLLAVVYRALDPVLEDDYMDWWDDGLPTDRVVAYLRDHADRFWLFHPDHPFLQANVDPIPHLLPREMDVFIAEPNGPKPFSNRSEASTRVMPYDEIARRLITALQYDKSMKHAAYAGAPGVTAQGAVYPKDSYLVQMSVIRLKTGSLMKDLLLSLIPLDAEDMFDFDDEDDLTCGVPTWEKPGMGVTGGGNKNNPLPVKSIQDALVWPSRRIRLLKYDDGITRAILSIGSFVSLHGLDHIEPMAAFKMIKDKTTKQDVLTPVIIYSEKAFWRSFPSLIGVTATEKNGRAPMTLRWAAYLKEEGLLPEGYIGNVSVSTIAFSDLYKSKVSDFMSDHVSLPLKVVNNPEAIRLIEKAVTVSEAMVSSAYKWLITDINRAEGMTAKEAVDAAKARMPFAYDVLGESFNHWVGSIPQLGDDAYSDWVDRSIDTLETLGDKLIGNASLSSLMGRTYNNDGTYSSVIAEDIFHNTLRKIKREEIGKQ